MSNGNADVNRPEQIKGQTRNSLEVRGRWIAVGFSTTFIRLPLDMQASREHDGSYVIYHSTLELSYLDSIRPQPSRCPAAFPLLSAAVFSNREASLASWPKTDLVPLQW